MIRELRRNVTFIFKLTQCLCVFLFKPFLKVQVGVQDEFDATSNCTLFAPKLFPELNPGEDRIFEQLTYTTCLNGTAEEKSKPLTILLWDGGASWSENSLQSGQEVK